MENNNEKFRLRLNLFDGIVLVLAVIVAGLLVWNHLKPETPAEDDKTSTLEYVVRLQRWTNDTVDMIHEGDKLVDNVKNFELGTVKSVEVIPATGEVFNENDKCFDRAEVPGYSDILVTVVSDSAAVGSDMIKLDGGVQLRVGMSLYIRGQGYMGSGPVVSIERAEEVA